VRFVDAVATTMLSLLNLSRVDDEQQETSLPHLHTVNNSIDVFYSTDVEKHWRKIFYKG